MEQPKCSILQKYVNNLRVKDVRYMFSIMRKTQEELTPDSFFPQYGITVGEFSTAYVVNMSQRQSKT